MSLLVYRCERFIIKRKSNLHIDVGIALLLIVVVLFHNTCILFVADNTMICEMYDERGQCEYGASSSNII